MISCRIVEAQPVHVGIIAGQLTAAERLLFKGIGRDPRRVIRGFFRQSSYRRTALLDDRPVAIWGVTGTLVASTGILWLRLSSAVRRMPVLVVKECEVELGIILSMRREVVAYIHEGDARALRFAEFFGFEFDEPALIEGIGLARRGAIRR